MYVCSWTGSSRQALHKGLSPRLLKETAAIDSPCQDNCGEIKWPYRLTDDAADHHSYTNPEITKAFVDAQGAIADICLGHLAHPAWDDYQAWMLAALKPPKAKPGEPLRKPVNLAQHSQNFTGTFDLDILPGDYSLMDPHLHFVIKRTASSDELGESEEWRRCMMDLAMLLFKLVILRVYLGRSWGDDMQIYHLAHRLSAKQLKKIKPDDPFAEAKHGCIIRHLTIPEQVLLAAQGVKGTHSSSMFASDFCKIKRKPSSQATIDPDFVLTVAIGTSTSAYVWAAPSLTGIYRERLTVVIQRPRPQPRLRAQPDAPLVPSDVGGPASIPTKRNREDETKSGEDEEEDAGTKMDVDNPPVPPRRSKRKRSRTEGGTGEQIS